MKLLLTLLIVVIVTGEPIRSGVDKKERKPNQQHANDKRSLHGSLIHDLAAFVRGFWNLLPSLDESGIDDEQNEHHDLTLPPKSDVPSTQPSDIPSTKPSDHPSFGPSGGTSDIASGFLSDAPSQKPSDVPSSMPSDVPSSAPSDVPSLIPSDAPSSVPSDAPSSAPSDVPSSAPSDVPSMVPSDTPSIFSSEMSSDMPSNMPSDQPSMVPSDFPSINPKYWQEDTVKDSGSIFLCPNTRSKNINLNAPTLEIAYSYRMEMTIDEPIDSIIVAIEELLQSYLSEGVGSICNSDNIYLKEASGITSSPNDSFFSPCTVNDATIGSCSYISGLTTVYLNEESQEYDHEVHCMLLDRIQSFLKSGMVESEFLEVSKIHSTIIDSLIVPDFCKIVGSDNSIILNEEPSDAENDWWQTMLLLLQQFLKIVMS